MNTQETEWPQPISTAPKDGTFILTDVGIVSFFHQDAMPGLREINAWVSQKFDDGTSYFMDPLIWQPLPKIVDVDELQ